LLIVGVGILKGFLLDLVAGRNACRVAGVSH